MRRPNPARTIGLLVVLIMGSGSPAVGQDRPGCPAWANPDAAAGWDAFRAEQFEGAETAFQEALRRCPDHEGALTGIGYVFLRTGRPESARDAFLRVIELTPENIDAQVGAGLAAWQLGDLDGVHDRFTAVELLEPGHPQAAFYLSRIPPGLGDPPPLPPLVVPDSLILTGRTAGDRFQVLTPEGWKDFWIRGMNLGAALPGRHPSEFPDRETYRRWLTEMAAMDVNTIRVYTIHPPHFYEELARFNRDKPHAPLRLLHGVWTELPTDDDFMGAEFEGEFFAEILRVVDLLHGRADIRPRPGHASGFYRADVSEWVLGYILGREWEPHTVMVFDSLRADLRGFQGRFVRVTGGNAMDAWLGRAVDTLVAYETDRYGTQRPVAWTNWPTLDPLHHPTESTVDEEVSLRVARGERVDVPPREYDNDAIGVDPSLLRATGAFSAGTFAAYHVYPYYPDLLILSDRYAGARSSLGPSHYMGYLRELKEHHRDLPVVIAEYGVPASHGTAHLQPQGWHHGGLSEAEQAEINRRLTLEIAEAGMAGGILFAWIDEWFKKNWLVIEFEIPQERNRLWLNRYDAEQHYGMLANEPVSPVAGETMAARDAEWRQIRPLQGGDGLTLRVAHDAAYLWIRVETPGRVPGDTLLVGFDILDSEGGEFRWPGAPNGPELPFGVEFVVVDDGRKVQVLAHPPYNPYRIVPVGEGGTGPTADPPPFENPPPGLFRARAEMRQNIPYWALPRADGIFDSLLVISNRRRIARDGREFLATGYDRGILPEGPLPDGLFQRVPGILELRIPWNLLNVTDPSSRSVLLSPPADPPGLRQTLEGRVVPETALDLDARPAPEFTRSVEVESVGVVAALRRGGEGWIGRDPHGPGEDLGRYRWSSWEDPQWRVRPRPTYRVMTRTFSELDPYGVRAPAAAPEEVGWRDRDEAPRVVEKLGEKIGSAEDTLVAQADLAWRAGNTQEAERLYRLILDRMPEDGRALHRLALMAAWAGRTEEALELIDRLIEIEPGNMDARSDRARFLAWAGRLEESVSSYDQLLGISPEDRAIRRDRARTLSWADEFGASIEAYRTLREEDPGDIEARLGLAQVLSFSDRLEEAVEEYEGILALDPQELRALRGKGRALAWGGDLRASEAVLRHAVSLDPEDPDTRVSLAQVLRWQGRTVAALAELEAAERLAPDREDIAEQRRRVDAAIRPTTRLTLASEGDSDGNRMTTLSTSADLAVVRRIRVRADAYHRFLSQGELHRRATGVLLGVSLAVEPGWTISLGGGTSGSDARGIASMGAASLGLTSPGRYPVTGSIQFTRSALDATALLAERGVRVSGFEGSLRWSPASRWVLAGGGGTTVFQGEERNRRRHGSVSLTRRVRGRWTMGIAGRGFHFQSELREGYFSPRRFLLGEGTVRWLHELGSWSVLLEGAPGVQRVRSDDPTLTLRTSGRLTYRIAPGREFFLGGGASSAGVQTFASEKDYRYWAFLAGASWVF